MTKKEVVKSIHQSIIAGKTKQETFDILKDSCEFPLRKLAYIIKSIPTLKAKQKCRKFNITLTILLTLTFWSKIVLGFVIVDENGIGWLPFILIVLIVSLYLLIGVATYIPESHKLVGTINLIGLIVFFITRIGAPFNLLILFDEAITLLVIWIAFYLHLKLYPDYWVIKERYQNSQGQIKNRDSYKFID